MLAYWLQNTSRWPKNGNFTNVAPFVPRPDLLASNNCVNGKSSHLNYVSGASHTLTLVIASNHSLTSITTVLKVHAGYGLKVSLLTHMLHLPAAGHLVRKRQVKRVVLPQLWGLKIVKMPNCGSLEQACSLCYMLGFLHRNAQPVHSLLLETKLFSILGILHLACSR